MTCRYEEVEQRLGRHLSSTEEMAEVDCFLTGLETEEAGLLSARTQAVAASWQLLAKSRYLPDVGLPAFCSPSDVHESAHACVRQGKEEERRRERV